MIKELAVINVAPLETLVKRAADLYYNSEQLLKLKQPERVYLAKMLKIEVGPTMTDSVFDAAVDKLKQLKPNSPALKVGAPIKKNKVKLPFPMFSLDKIKPSTGAVAQWASNHPGLNVVSDKLDGVSIEIDYRVSPPKAYTRGNGTVGGDISYLVPHLKIPQSLKSKRVVRGEIIMSRSKFEAWNQQFENARNMAAGLTNRNDIHPGVKDLSVVVYGQLFPKERPSKYLPQLKNLGLRIVNYEEWYSEDLTDKYLSEHLIKRKQKCLYEMDGLVVCQDVVPGNSTGNPTWAVAFKQTMAEDIVKAKVLRVVWEASKHGKLVPVIEIEPVKLSGVTVKRATAFNAGFVDEHSIGPGAIVKLTRSGDVIPHILDVLKSAAKPQMPPKSFGEWKWDATEVNIFLTNVKSDPVVLAKRITSFFTTLGVEYLSIGIVTKFIDAGLDTIEKIITATPAKMVKLVPGVQDTLAKKLYTNIQDAITDADLASLMDASLVFGQNMGTKRASMVLKKEPKILSKAKLPQADIQELIEQIPGFSTTTAKQFAVGLPKFVAWLKKHPSITYVVPVISVKKNGSMVGQSVVFTGVRSDAAEAWIIKEGGEVGSGVTSKTTILVAKDPNASSSKLDKARSLGVKIMSLDAFMKRVK